MAKNRYHKCVLLAPFIQCSGTCDVAVIANFCNIKEQEKVFLDLFHTGADITRRSPAQNAAASKLFIKKKVRKHVPM